MIFYALDLEVREDCNNTIALVIVIIVMNKILQKNWWYNLHRLYGFLESYHNICKNTVHDGRSRHKLSRFFREQLLFIQGNRLIHIFPTHRQLLRPTLLRNVLHQEATIGLHQNLTILLFT